MSRQQKTADPEALSERIHALRAEGKSIREVAGALRMPMNTVYYYIGERVKRQRARKAAGAEVAVGRLPFKMANLDQRCPTCLLLLPCGGHEPIEHRALARRER